MHYYLVAPRDGSAEARTASYAVIAGQDCDLTREYESRAGGVATSRDSILVFEASPAAEAQSALPGRDVRKPAFQNKNERYQFLQSYNCGENEALSFPALLIDFRKLFTVTAEQLFWQCYENGNATRCAYLIPPYRDHMQTRAMFYLGRVALDVDHDVTV